MKLDKGALAITLIYVAVFAAAFFAAIDIEPDEFLLEEGGYASNLTIPFSILTTAVLSVIGIELFESAIWAYIIWFTGAVLNAGVIYILASRTLAMLRTPAPSSAISQS